MNAILNSYVEVLSNYNNFNNESINSIEYIPKIEKEKIIKSFNSNEIKYDYNKFYHVEFSKMAKEIPDKCAIVCNDISITYKQLDEMSNSLAHYLRKQNIGKGDIVPIICERSHYFIIAFLAVMKSGAAYSPIDPEFPRERIEYMINQVNAKYILKYITDFKNNEKIKFEHVLEYELEKHNYEKDKFAIDNVNKIDDLCYILYTSGTTGKPKGTMVTHMNLTNFIFYNDIIKGEKDIFNKGINNALAITKFTHDISIGEIHFPLLKGSRIILCNDNEFNDAKLLSLLINKYNVDYIFTVPSRFDNYLSDEEFIKSIENANYIVLGGECIDFKLVEKIQNNSKCEVLSIYGPTETTVYSTIKVFEKIDSSKGNIPLITAGKPCCNCSIFILDKYLKPVPIGVEGEIFIGGFGVSNGYINREELTKEKYLDCPFDVVQKGNGKMYGSGDIGKWTENGEIVCIGRMDFQVKIHGQRIELEEIENTIKMMDNIKNAIVIDGIRDNGDKYLIGYYISSLEINSLDIIEFLKNKLPRYMIPNYFMRIETLPLTINGKLDRKSLPKPNINDLINEEYVEPETEIEKVICGIYANVFNLNENVVGKTSDFFELGGDSLNVIKVTSFIEKELGIKLNIKDILSNSLVYNLSRHIEEILNSNEEIYYHSESIEKHNSNEFPITSQQLGVYIDSIKNPESTTYNIP
ncbi:acetyl-CoA synthetase-like protein, partial [Anaeromyces robustus]